MGWGYGYGDYPRRLTVGERRAKARREMENLAKKGEVIRPVVIEGRKITKTFWGNAWCKHIEGFSDYASRLPRGRSYVCNGSVVDLQIDPGKVTARVMGSRLYAVKISIKPLPASHWDELKKQCSGQIGSLVELLQGKLSNAVMEVVTARGKGLFPEPREIELDCSCPDGARLCKHLAAVLYAVGARLDEHPDLLFYLRQVDHTELINAAGASTVAGMSDSGTRQTIAADALADVFGIELEDAPSPLPSPPTPPQKDTPLPAKAGRSAPPKPTRKAAKRTVLKAVASKPVPKAATKRKSPPKRTDRAERSSSRNVPPTRG